MRVTRIGAFALMAALSVEAAAAERHWPKIEARASAYLTDFGSEFQVNDSNDVPGSDLDLEDELGLEDGLEELRLDLRWRFRPRHALDFSYYDISRDGNRTASRVINIGDEVYTIGTRLDTTLDFTVYKASYAYSVSQSAKQDVALSLGLHVMDVGFEVDGFLLNIPVNRHDSEITVPLPVLGFQWYRRLGGPFSLIFDTELFAIKYDDYKGSFFDANLTLDVGFTDRFGGFVSLNWVSMHLESDDSDMLGEFDYRYGAVAVGLRYAF